MPDDGHLVVHESNRERVLGQYVSSGGDRSRIVKRYVASGGDRVLVWSAFRDKTFNESLSASVVTDHEDVEEFSRSAPTSLSESLTRNTEEHPPSAPSNLSATAGCDQIDLSWTDNSDNEDEFEIHRDGSLYDSVGTDVTTYTDSSPGSSSRDYKVRACNTSGCSSFTSTVTETANSAPAAPSNVSASVPTCDGSKNVSVSWTDNSDDEDNFNIEYRVDGSGDAYSQLCQANANETSITCGAATLTNGETYETRVVAVNSCGETASTNTDTVTMTSDPSAPSGCSASWDDGSGSSPGCAVDLSWTDNATNECGYKVYRKLQTDSNYGTEIADISANSTSYRDSDASENTDYDYKIEAYNDVGTGSCTTSISTTSCEGGTT